MSNRYAAFASSDNDDGTGWFVSDQGARQTTQICRDAAHWLIGIGLFVGLGLSTTMINCKGQGHIPPCGASQLWGHLWCNGIADPQDPTRQCVNMCGTVVGDVASSAHHVRRTTTLTNLMDFREGTEVSRKLRGSEARHVAGKKVRRTDVSRLSTSCLSILRHDTGSLDVLQNCSEHCSSVLPEQPASPFCWSDAVTKVCLKANTGKFFGQFPSVTGQILGVCYVILSLSLAFCCKDRRQMQNFDWGWADSLEWPFPWNLVKKQGPEQELSRLQLQQTAVSMIAERASDVASLWTYLKKGQPFFALLMFTVLILSGDMLQTHGLSELLESIDRSWVPSRGLAEAKAREGFTDGVWGFLVPSMSLFASQLNYLDASTLMFAAATSLYGVYEGVGSSQDIASAMVGNPLMPFRSQRKITQPKVQALRVAETLALIPAAAVAATRDLRSAYFTGLLVLLPGALSVSVFATSAFNHLNPKVGRTCGAALGALVLSALGWPFGLLWPGGFFDPVASCANRHRLLQTFAAAQPPRYFYTIRILQALLCFIVLVAPSTWLEWLPVWALRPAQISPQQICQQWTPMLLLVLGLIGMLMLMYFASGLDGLLSITKTPAGEALVLQEMLAQQKYELGPGHTEVAITLTNLGNAYGALGDHSKEKEMLERALVIEKRVLTPIA